MSTVHNLKCNLKTKTHSLMYMYTFKKVPETSVHSPGYFVVGDILSLELQVY